MSTSAIIILDTRYESSKGFPIKIRVTNKVSKYVSLKLYSKKEWWENGNVNKFHPDYRKLFFKLNKRGLQLTEEIEYCNDNKLNLDESLLIIKKGIQDTDTERFVLSQKLKELDNQSGITFFEFCNTRIEEKRAINESISHYESVRDIVYRYDPEITLNGITYEWVNDFINTKLSGKVKRGGVNSYLRTMGAVFREAQRRSSLGIKKDDPFKGTIKDTGRKKEIVRLEKNDFIKLLNFIPEKINKQQRLTQTRNLKLWLFQFYIGGHDLIDIALLKWEDMKRDRVSFKRYKLRNKPNGGLLVDNYVFPFAMDIINIIGTKKEDRIFSFIPDPVTERKKYDYFLRAYNRSLGNISTKLELIDTITSKSTRFLFRSKAGELLMSDIPVSQIQAHILKGKSMTFNYQGRLPNNIIDKCHKKILRKTFKFKKSEFYKEFKLSAFGLILL